MTKCRVSWRTCRPFLGPSRWVGDLLLGWAKSGNSRGAHLVELLTRTPQRGAHLLAHLQAFSWALGMGASSCSNSHLTMGEAAVCARYHSQICDVSGAAGGHFHMLLQPAHLRQRPLLRQSRVIHMCGCVVVLTCTAVTGSDNARGRAGRYMLGGSWTAGASPA